MKWGIGMSKKLCPLILLAILIGTPVFMQTGKSSTSLPNVYVSPSSQSVSLGGHFSVDVDLDNASNLYAYEIWLNFDSSKLNATALKYDGYLNGSPQIYSQTINNAGRYIDFAVTSNYPAQPKNGGSPPALVTINFTAIALGTSTLHLNETRTILVSSLNGGTPITHSTSDGAVTVAGLVHDIALTNIQPAKTIFGKGYPMSFNVTVQNKGSYTETFLLQIYANTTFLTQNITLTKGNSKTITFTWNNLAYGNYTIGAYAWPVPGETNTADNTYTYGVVKVTIPGDTNGDKTVNVLDLILITRHLGHSTPWPHPSYSSEWYTCANTDLNSDGQHNVLDFILCATHLNQHWS